jgi:8-hydroxy-5-deazaflavin:NADPH oxidoreductase
MATAVIGIGTIGKVVAQHLVTGGERVVLASRREADAATFAEQLGPQAGAASVEDAIAQANTVVLTVWFDTINELVAERESAFAGKSRRRPSNSVAAGADGQLARTLPDGVSAGSVIAEALPASAHFVKAFGTLTAATLQSAANRQPRRAVLFYATDDDVAAAEAERLITTAGFDAVKAGGLENALSIEMFGALHEYGGLDASRSTETCSASKSRPIWGPRRSCRRAATTTTWASTSGMAWASARRLLRPWGCASGRSPCRARTSPPSAPVPSHRASPSGLSTADFSSATRGRPPWAS